MARGQGSEKILFFAKNNLFGYFEFKKQCFLTPMRVQPPPQKKSLAFGRTVLLLVNDTSDRQKNVFVAKKSGNTFEQQYFSIGDPCLVGMGSWGGATLKCPLVKPVQSEVAWVLQRG